MPLTVGDRLGHYDVTALIGEGGMGQTQLNGQPMSSQEKRKRLLAYPLLYRRQDVAIELEVRDAR